MPANITKNRDNLGTRGAVRQLAIQHNKLVDDAETNRQPDCVILNVGAGLSVDANANDIEMDNAICVRWKGIEFPFAQEDPIDISTKTINTDTIATSKAGTAWVFADLSTGITDVESPVAASATATTLIEALSQYSVATNTLPPLADQVPIGCVAVVEGGSGTFTWGPDSITAEGETYYSFRGIPCVVTALASFAATAGAAATFAYGAGVVRLGTGTIVSATGKTGVAFDVLFKTDIPHGKTGVWFLYILADDVEIALQYGGAGYDTLLEAQQAVRAHNANPLLPIAGIIYIQNASGAAFVPGTTNLNVAGLTNTFEIVAAGTKFLFGNDDDLTAAKIGNPAGTAITS